MTDYYLKDVHCFADSATGRLNARDKAAGLPFAVVRLMGMHQTVYELKTDPDRLDCDEQAPFQVTPLEHEALEAKRLFGKVVVGVDPASPDGDRDAVVVGVSKGGKVEITDMVTLNPGQHVVGVDENGILTISSASIGQVNAGVMKFKHPDGSVTEHDFDAGEIRFHDTPGQRKLNDEEAVTIAAIKANGGSFIELIESCRRFTRLPDCNNPARVIHTFPDDAHAGKLQNALDRAEEAIMWAVKYITAGE